VTSRQLAVPLSIDVSTDVAHPPLSQARIREIATFVLGAERVKNAMVSIALVSNAQIARLNRRHLHHGGPTDVISFALGETPSRNGGKVIVADVYIAPDVARANARRLGGGVREEVARLVVHGLLHVLGHDHPDGEDRLASPMWRRQESLLATLGKRGVIRVARQ
jgi:rRNA maturation RNase YbeY